MSKVGITVVSIVSKFKVTETQMLLLRFLGVLFDVFEFFPILVWNMLISFVVGVNIMAPVWGEWITKYPIRKGRTGIFFALDNAQKPLLMNVSLIIAVKNGSSPV